MRIIYIANVRIPTERAHGIQIMNTCAALARAGNQVELVVPERRNTSAEDLFDFYKIDRTFSVTYLPSIDLIGKTFVLWGAFWVQSLSFFCSVFFKYRKNFKDADTIFYGRDEMLVGLLSLCTDKAFWEAHMGGDNVFTKMIVRRSRGIITITKALADLYGSKGVARACLHVSPDAVDIERFNAVSGDMKALRAELSLPTGAKIATYSGSLGSYSWKGVDVFLDSLAFGALASNASVRYMLVGGSPSEVATLQKKYSDSRIIWIGQVKPDAVPRYLKASDVLVIPNKSGNAISELYTSPMKLFEYMAAKKPIVASDLPSIREIVDERSVAFAKAGDAAGFASAIQGLFADSDRAARLAEKAFADVGQYSWDSRARGIMGFLNSHD